MQTHTRPNDPAFPAGGGRSHSGMTMREHFAAMCMQAVLSRGGVGHQEAVTPWAAAALAVECADALVSALNGASYRPGRGIPTEF